MYDNCQGGQRNWSSANSYCSSKGMRLPAYNETSAKDSNGVSSCGVKWTWTSTYYNGGSNHSIWNGTIGNNDDSSSSNYVRCVK